MSGEGWNRVSLADVSQIVTGGTPPTDDFTLYGRDHLFVSPADISDAKFVQTTGKMLSNKGWARSKQLPRGSILFVCIGSTIGKVAVLGESGTTNQQINAVIASNDVSSNFLYYMLASKSTEVRASASEQAVPIINKSTFGDLEIAMPGLEEQEAIAEALGDADGVIEALERLIVKKRRIKQGAMQDLLTAKRRLPGFSGDWIERKLGSVATLQRGFDLPNSIRQDGDYPVVYSNGIMATHKHFMCEGPGVVTGRSGTIGNVTFVGSSYWPHNTALWVKNFFGNDPKFIFYLLQFFDLSRFASGSGVPTLNRNDAHEDQVLIPLTVDEQIEIRKLLDNMGSEITAFETRLQKARAIKEGMMQNLLTGRIRLV